MFGKYRDERGRVTSALDLALSTPQEKRRPQKEVKSKKIKKKKRKKVTFQLFFDDRVDTRTTHQRHQTPTLWPPNQFLFCFGFILFIFSSPSSSSSSTSTSFASLTGFQLGRVMKLYVTLLEVART